MSLSNCSLPHSDLIFLQLPGDLRSQNYFIRSTILGKCAKVRQFNCNVLRPPSLFRSNFLSIKLSLDQGVLENHGIPEIWLRAGWAGVYLVWVQWEAFRWLTVTSVDSEVIVSHPRSRTTLRHTLLAYCANSSGTSTRAKRSFGDIHSSWGPSMEVCGYWMRNVIWNVWNRSQPEENSSNHQRFKAGK